MLEDMIPILSDGHKKTIPGPRIEQLNKLLTISNFQENEPYLIEYILPIVLKRMDDKPEVVDVALNVGKEFVSKLYIQLFPRVIEILFNEMKKESKWSW